MKKSGLNLEATRDLFTVLYLIAYDAKTPNLVREKLLFCLTALRKGLPKHGDGVSRQRLNNIFFELVGQRHCKPFDVYAIGKNADECVDNLRLFFRYEED